MHLEINHPRVRPGRIQFPRTIQALDARVIHQFHVVGRFAVGGGAHGHGEVGGEGDGCVAHCAFEFVGGVGCLELVEGVEEPGRWRGLMGGEGMVLMRVFVEEA